MSNNNNQLTLSAPLSGPVLPLGNVPDEVFAVARWATVLPSTP